MRRAAVVVNSAGTRHLDRLQRSCGEVGRLYGWDVALIDMGLGPAPGQGRAELASYLSAGTERLVLAAGGDGIARACAEVIVTLGADVPLAVVPLGTANLFAQALGTPQRTEAALAVGFGGNERRVDVGKCNGRVFVAMAGTGLDAAVVGATPAHLKQHLGWFSYAIAGLSNLHLPPHDFTVSLDGKDAFSCSARSVVIGNTGCLPGGFSLMPEARLDDGLLDVAVLAPRGAMDWALLADHVLAGKKHDEAYLRRHQAKSVEVTANADLPRQLDGEAMAPGRSLAIEVLHQALLVRSP
ncbi:MAG: diacylglycerol/lipid kinase family protein [Acidimicrobiales bacterium]